MKILNPDNWRSQVSCKKKQLCSYADFFNNPLSYCHTSVQLPFVRGSRDRRLFGLKNLSNNRLDYSHRSA